MNHEKRSIRRTESQGKGRGITIKVVSLKPRPLDTQLIVIITHARQIPSQVTRLEVPLGQLFMNGYRHKENRMDVFPDTQLLHGGLSTRLPCKSMEQMHCPGGNSAIFFFVSWGLFHDRFRLFKFADSFIECFTNSCGNYMRFPF